jgi:hypothetical protein
MRIRDYINFLVIFFILLLNKNYIIWIINKWRFYSILTLGIILLFYLLTKPWNINKREFPTCSIWHSIKINWSTIKLLFTGIMIRSSVGMFFREQIFNDVNNVELAHQIISSVKRNNVYYFNLINLSYALIVFDYNDLNFIMENSPYIFGVGPLKKQVFSHFMNENVGVSNLVDNWEIKRKFNINILELDKQYNDRQTYHYMLKEIGNINIDQLNTFDKINNICIELTIRIVFGDSDIEGGKHLINELINIMKKGNTFMLKKNVNKDSISKYYALQKKYINSIKINSNKNTLISRSFDWIAKEKKEDIELIDFYQQIPHWMFPIFGGAANTIAKVMILLAAHPHIQAQCINNKELIEYVIIDTLRLYPGVRTQLRKTLKDTHLSNIFVKKDTDIMIINSGIQRNYTIFNNANLFNPNMVKNPVNNNYISYFNSFGKGSQKCPGKNLILPLMVEVIHITLQKHFYSLENKKTLFDYNKTLPDEINFLNMKLNTHSQKRKNLNSNNNCPYF